MGIVYRVRAFLVSVFFKNLHEREKVYVENKKQDVLGHRELRSCMRFC